MTADATPVVVQNKILIPKTSINRNQDVKDYQNESHESLGDELNNSMLEQNNSIISDGS